MVMWKVDLIGTVLTQLTVPIKSQTAKSISRTTWDEPQSLNGEGGTLRNGQFFTPYSPICEDCLLHKPQKNNYLRGFAVLVDCSLVPRLTAPRCAPFVHQLCTNHFT